MSLETEEEIQTDMESALSFQDNLYHKNYWQFKIARLLIKSKQDLSISLSQWKENFDGSYQDLSTKGLKHTMSKNPNHASRRGQA